MIVILICESGRLYTPRSAIHETYLLNLFSGNPILIQMHEGGDCDTIKWPDYCADGLRAALYDCRESGVIPPDTKSVLLPDGKPFDID